MHLLPHRMGRGYFYLSVGRTPFAHRDGPPKPEDIYTSTPLSSLQSNSNGNPMIPDPIPPTPAARAPPIPHPYQIDRYRPYLLPPLAGYHIPAGIAQNPSPLSTCPPGPSRYAPLQTVEDIIARGYLAIPGGDSTTAILNDKRDTSWLGLDDAIRQIRARYQLYARNMNGILYATAAATNTLHTWKAERGWYNERQLDNQQKTLQNLYAQEREERTSLWRDLARVRATLPEVVQQYLAAHRKLSILDDIGGEDP